MPDLGGERVLVTGATGFIGANLTHELIRRGAQVYALVRAGSRLWRIEELVPSLHLCRADLTDWDGVRRAVDEARPTIIFHLAAAGGHPASGPDRLEALKVAILGATHLLGATAAHDYRRFVHVGSSLEYGPKDTRLSESDAPEPSTYRGAYKAAATVLCRQFARAQRKPIVILRPFSVYGYWESATRLIPTAILAALRDREMALTAPGFRRDFVFVEDVIEACLLAVEADSAPGEIVNVGSGRQWSNEAVVDLVQAVAGHAIRIRLEVHPAHPPDTPHWVADIRKAKAVLGWQPRHLLGEGLEKTVAWFGAHLDEYTD